MLNLVARRIALNCRYGFGKYQTIPSASKTVSSIARRFFSTTEFPVEIPLKQLKDFEARLRILERKIKTIETTTPCGWDQFFPYDNECGLDGIDLNQATHQRPRVKVNFSRISDIGEDAPHSDESSPWNVQGGV